MNATRLRIDLRLLCELLIAGIFNSKNKLESDAALLVASVVGQLVRADPSAFYSHVRITDYAIWMCLAAIICSRMFGDRFY